MQPIQRVRRYGVAVLYCVAMALGSLDRTYSISYVIFCLSFNLDHVIPYRRSHKLPILRVKYRATVFTKPLASPVDSARVFREIWDKDRFTIQEQVYVLFLNSAGEAFTWWCVNTGSCDKTVFDIKTMIALTTGCLACKVIVAHNHPSGNLKPSNKDIFYTNKLYRALELVDVVLLDHIILGADNYFSFKENGVPME